MASPIEKLLADYAALAASPNDHLTDDQRRSLMYYEVEAAVGGVPAVRVDRVAAWIRAVQRLDDFISGHGRLPRENNRLVEPVPAQEQSLADWVRYQRRPATRDLHCDYQRRRLECIPGFQWDPLDMQWNTMFAAFARFVGKEHRAPRYRSDDPSERALATWAAKQRQLLRNGKLSARRRKKLESLSFRVTGKRQR